MKNMAKFCPECGKSVENATSKFCDNCGASLDSSSVVVKKESVQEIQEEKSPVLAALCSFFIPGLGQVYDGETARGVGIFFGTLIGLFIFIIPGLIVWLFGMYDDYTIAKKMSDKEIPFKPTKTAHMILFFILVVFIVAVVIFFVVLSILATIFAPLATQMHQ
jgi:TM2 domain-containing membrane protein YozV